MERQQQDMLLGAQAEQAQAPQRWRDEVERLARLGPRQILQLAFAIGLVCCCEILNDQLKRLVVADTPRDLPVIEREARAQRFVPAENLIKARLQGRQVQLPAQAHGCRYIVSGAAGIKLVQEPHALLRKARRIAAINKRGGAGRRLPGAPTPRLGGDRFGKLRNGRVFKESAKREVAIEGVAQARNQPRRYY